VLRVVAQPHKLSVRHLDVVVTGKLQSALGGDYSLDQRIDLRVAKRFIAVRLKPRESSLGDGGRP
jgi:hypothetical protein